MLIKNNAQFTNDHSFLAGLHPNDHKRETLSPIDAQLLKTTRVQGWIQDLDGQDVVGVGNVLGEGDDKEVEEEEADLSLVSRVSVDPLDAQGRGKVSGFLKGSRDNLDLGGIDKLEALDL